MKHLWLTRLLAFALLLAMTASLGAPAFADGYAADQSYQMDKSGERVFAVRVVRDEEPEALRDALLAEGYDAYLYENSGRTDVLCGKYRSGVEANAAWEEMKDRVKDARVLMSTAWLPKDAIDAFEAGPTVTAAAAGTWVWRPPWSSACCSSSSGGRWLASTTRTRSCWPWVPIS